MFLHWACRPLGLVFSFAILVDETAQTLGKIFSGAERGGTASWKTLLGKMNSIADGESFYGASGIRDDTFHP